MSDGHEYSMFDKTNNAANHHHSQGRPLHGNIKEVVSNTAIIIFSVEYQSHNRIDSRANAHA